METRARKGKRGKAPAWSWPDWRLLGRWVLGLALFLMMGGAAVWGVIRLQDPRVMPLNVVRIDGDFRYMERRHLEEAVAGAIRGNFFTVDVERVREAARSLPWVDEVSVRRVWPGTLQMQVKEQQPLARWGESALINGRGEVFRPPESEFPEGLPSLAGPEGSGKEVVDGYRRIKADIAPLGLGVSRLTRDERGGWRLLDDKGMTVRFGTRNAEQRLARFIRIYPRLIAENPRPLVSVDMRYTNGVAVRWGEIAPARKDVFVEPGAQEQPPRRKSSLGRPV